MRVRRIGYVGLRTPDVAGMTWFFRDVLGLESAGEDATVTYQRLPTHRRDLVEVYAESHRDIRMIPDDADCVIAFVVDDIREAMAEVQAAGLELVNQPVGPPRRTTSPASVSSRGFGCARLTDESLPSSKFPTDDAHDTTFPRRSRRSSGYDGDGQSTGERTWQTTRDG